MKKPLRLLSDSMAALLRLSFRKVTSAHISETVEESFDQHSSSLSDQQPTASDDKTLTTSTTMSLQPKKLQPYSYLQAIFNLTLVEYSKQTGIDLTTHPIVSSLDDNYSIDETINVLRERSRPLNNPQMGDKDIQLICQLKSIFYIVSLLTPSEALCGHIDPVCQSVLDLNSHTFYMCIF